MKELVPDPEQVERFRPQLTDLSFGTGWALGFLNRLIVELAEIHARDCGLASCSECRELVTALSLFAAYQIEHPPRPDLLKKMGRSGE